MTVTVSGKAQAGQFDGRSSADGLPQPTLGQMARYYLDMVAGVNDYLRSPLPTDPAGVVRAQLEQREELWLDTIRSAVFERPEHPYHRMFRLAGCTIEDLRESVKSEGLEPTLKALRDEGVYLTHEELKGRAAIVRCGREIPSGKKSFDNPAVLRGMQTTSGGSRSEGTRSTIDTGCRMHRDAYHCLNIEEFGLADRVQIQVKPVLPAGAGLGSCMSYARLGCPVTRWFAFGGPLRNSAHFRILTHLLVLLARLHGTGAPFPIHLSPNDFSAVASFIAGQRRRKRLCAVGSFASAAVRIVAAARDRGLDIQDTLFLVSGEALTEAKRALIEDAGCRVFSRYHIAEVGPIGYGCRRMTSGNCVHLFSDAVAAVNYRQRAPLTDVEVDSILFTTLLPSAAKILINADMDDAGRVEPVDCDCTWSRVGFTHQVSGIHSVGKLTGHGMSLVGTEMVYLLEHKLPARFGGAPADFQLVETEENARTQLVLRVSPRVGNHAIEDIGNFFLDEVQSCYTGRLASRVWRNAGALRVIRAEPLVTPSGKVLQLQLLGNPPESHHAA